MDETQYSAELDALAVAARDWFQLADLIRNHPLAGEDDSFRSLVLPFDYLFVEPELTNRREQYGCYSPMIEFTDSAYPAPLATIAGEILEFWARIAESSHHPLVRSRLHDLLWERRNGQRPDLHARAAIEDYLALASVVKIDDLDEATDLLRALELAALIGDQSQQSKIIPLCVNAAATMLGEGHPSPGPIVSLLEGIMRYARGDSVPGEIDELLDRAKTAFGDTGQLRDAVIELQMRRVGKEPEARAQLEREQIEYWLGQGSLAQGMLKIIHYERALELARSRWSQGPPRQGPAGNRQRLRRRPGPRQDLREG